MLIVKLIWGNTRDTISISIQGFWIFSQSKKETKKLLDDWRNTHIIEFSWDTDPAILEWLYR